MRVILGPMPCADCGVPLALVEPDWGRRSVLVMRVLRALGYVDRPRRVMVEAGTGKPHDHEEKV